MPPAMRPTVTCQNFGSGITTCNSSDLNSPTVTCLTNGGITTYN
jgi:hypothetical protein